jgi:predicted component of viral defense system (DUF524 family)
MRVDLPLLDDAGRRLGVLVIRTRPTSNCTADIIDLRQTGTEDGLEPVQLIEGAEYRFELAGPQSGVVRWEPSEHFDLDDESGRTGRIRPRLSTGRMEISATVDGIRTGTVDGIRTGTVAVEVRSVKLGYLDDYQSMLGAIARLAAELVLERFAASAQRLRIDDATTSETLYQRFVLLQALLKSDRLSQGLRRILAMPYLAWKEVERQVLPGQALSCGSSLVRRLVGPGPRLAWPDSTVDGLESLPRDLIDVRTDETLDNVPNRFVKHALEQWRGHVYDIIVALRAEARRVAPGQRIPAPISRGMAEAERLGDLLEDHLRHPMFADVGPLTSFPGANQVLQKRDGYCDVFETWMLYEYGANLEWKGGEDVFSGGQRDVATLYEYWVFLELAKIVGDLCDVKPDLSALISSTTSSLSLLLRRGEARTVGGGVTRRGRTFRLELWFNRDFRATASGGSWTRTMRPDCSLCIRPEQGVSPAAEEMWLHFDAKYRVNRIEAVDEDDTNLTAKNEDLLKMHAYRDGLLRAAGAYVVFPGDSEHIRRQYAEVLPSLGAFPLRPGNGTQGDGAAEIRAFLEEVIGQVADQGSRYERARFWHRTAFTPPAAKTSTTAVPFLEVPAADTLVLVGFVKSPEHAAWIATHRLYNLRAGERRGALNVRSAELGASFVLLYDEERILALHRVVGIPSVMSRDALLELGYPRPRGDVYFVLHLAPVDAPVWLAVSTVAHDLGHNRPRGQPFSVTWLELASAHEETGPQ